MLQISEWLPNPTGKDTAQNEWVELFNSGPATVNLGGWKLKTANGKTAALSGVVDSGGYKLIYRSATKLALRNTDETLTLISPQAMVADVSSFRGPAPEGEGVNHVGAASFFAKPTPGAANVLRASAFINEPHPYGVPLNHDSGALTLWGGMILTALTLSLAFLYIVKNSDDLSELFFSGDQALGF